MGNHTIDLVTNMSAANDPLIIAGIIAATIVAAVLGGWGGLALADWANK